MKQRSTGITTCARCVHGTWQDKIVARLVMKGNTSKLTSLFTHRKNHTGCVLPQQWLFGGVCRETDERFLVEVPGRTVVTLMEKIKDNIEPGTTIFSDSWSAHITHEIEREGFRHLKVNHCYNFVDPTSGAHTQTIE